MFDFSDYCRRIETYLCEKNGGHLIRIAGPAFEKVCGWAEQGVPLRVAFRGIDQCCERYYAKGPRRRPVRIEFCEADILDLFDDWRRAIGVTGGGPAGESVARPLRKPSLASHINRVLVRLSSIRATAQLAPAVAEEIDGVIADLDHVAQRAVHARGGVRLQIVDELASLDRRLIMSAQRHVEPHAAASLRREAEAELAGFGERMPPEARARATDAAFARLVRESLNLPVISYE